MLFQQVSSSCVIQRSGGAAFLCCSVRKPALPNQNQEVTAPSLSIRRFLACYVQSQRPSDYPPAATPGAPFTPMGKDAMTPWIFFSSRPPFYHKSHYVTRFCGRFLARTPPKKGSTKLGFFYIVSKILRHRLSTCKISASSLPAVKDACLFLTYAGEILLLPLPTVLDTYFRFLTTPGVRRGEKLSPPRIGIVALSPPPGAW